MTSRRFAFIGLLTALTIAAAALAAVTQGKTDGSASPAAASKVSGTVTLSGWKSSSVEDDLLRKVVDAFRRSHPNIKVNFVPFPGDTYDQTMLAKFSARKPPDVFYVNGHVFPNWVRQGVLAPLDSYVSKTHFRTTAFYKRLLNGFRYKGKLYGFPKDWSPLAMEVNTAMLAKAGVKAPTTWAQLTAAARKLASSGAVPDGKPICLSPDWARLMAFVYQNGGSGRPGDLFLQATSAPVRGAANYYVGLVKSGLAAPPDRLGSGWCGEAFGKQKAAIAFEGNWLIPFLKEQFPSVAFQIVPMVKNKAQGNLAFTVSYSMARDSKNKDAAWVLLSYLVGRQGMKKWTSLGLALPARSDVTPVSGRKAFLRAAPYARVWQGGAKYNDVVTVANNELTAVFQGNESVDSMLKKIVDAAKKAR